MDTLLYTAFSQYEANLSYKNFKFQEKIHTEISQINQLYNLSMHSYSDHA